MRVDLERAVVQRGGGAEAADGDVGADLDDADLLDDHAPGVGRERTEVDIAVDEDDAGRFGPRRPVLDVALLDGVAQFEGAPDDDRAGGASAGCDGDTLRRHGGEAHGRWRVGCNARVSRPREYAKAEDDLNRIQGHDAQQTAPVPGCQRQSGGIGARRSESVAINSRWANVRAASRPVWAEPPR